MIKKMYFSENGEKMIKKTFLLVMGLFLISNSCNRNNSIDSSPADCSSTPNTLAQSTNATIESFRQAMLTFRTSLTSDLLNRADACLDDIRLRQWSTVPPAFLSRDGINYGQLSADQLTKFKAIMQLFLSSGGYKKVDEISVLAEGFLNSKNSNDWNPNLYHITLFGDPVNSGSWGFQLDGHHCIVNFLVHGDNVSIVPAFLGSEPTTGTFNGTSFDIFKDERDLALQLYDGFTTSENTAAVSDGNAATMLVGSPENGTDNFGGTYNYSQFTNGLKYSDMSASTQANLVLLMKEYVYNLNTTFADIWWTDIMRNINDTYFVWLDNVATPTTQTRFYYRIYNPYLWVEYNMELPVAQGIEDWNHVHTVTRIPNNPSTVNGGDYNIFAQIVNKNDVQFLAQHYMNSGHHKNSGYIFDYQLKDNIEYKKHSHKHLHGDKHHHHKHGS